MTTKCIVTLLMAVAICSCSNVSYVCSNQKTVDSDPDSPIVTREITVKDVSEIDCARGIKVVYTQGATSSVVMSAPRDIADYIDVDVKNSSLFCTVGKEYQINTGLDRVEVKVSSPLVKSLGASTGASIKINLLDLKDNKLNVNASIAGSVAINSLKCGGLDCDVSTAGNATIIGIKCSGMIDASASTGAETNFEGIAAKIDFGASTGATINASELVAETGEASASTGADILCRVHNLNSSSSTGGSVHNKQ